MIEGMRSGRRSISCSIPANSALVPSTYIIIDDVTDLEEVSRDLGEWFSAKL